ncbi:spore coat protein [Mesobacillus zeae]|uniref:Spore coat protein n=1 Tax=Mesobacillus zeae TaxID=1917180 RepID=A0A398BDT7_9BACI|nr:spore coat protein [Mesobacillus zeae]RID88355.1 spore coat protein [Mesobacillus zeae]
MRNKNIGSHKPTASNHSFPGSLRGKTVTVYRGGPESKTGRLLEVGSDYVTLSVQDSSDVIYYQASHVKSISEDSKNNSIQLVQGTEEEVDYYEADCFASLINQLIQNSIKINQGGPESKAGTLLGANKDFLALFTEDDGTVYFNLHHVKSISLNSDEQEDEEEGSGQENVQYPAMINAMDFHDVFKYLEHNWVSINRGGPEAMEGVLVENTSGNYTLVCNQEVLRVHPFHIKSISCGPKGSLKKQNENENEMNAGQGQSNGDESESSDQYNSSHYEEESSSCESSSHDYHSSRYREFPDERRSHCSYTREKVTKTIDYVWKCSR